MWRSAARLRTRRAGAAAAACFAAGGAAAALWRRGGGCAAADAPLFTFAVIADVQHADIEDGWNFHRTTARRFRGALEELRLAVAWWQRRAAEQSVTFIAQLGDLIDGRNAALGQSREALQKALDLLAAVPLAGPASGVYHLIGNHELYNFNRKQLAELLNTAPPPRGVEYYSFEPHPEWRVLVLDGYQESIIGWDKGTPQWEAAVQLLRNNNPNDVLSPTDWFRDLPKDKHAFVPYNGAFGAAQLQWLGEELQSARKRGQRVLVLSHIIIHRDACDGSTLAWDWPEALRLMHESGCVAAVLSGHDHKGGYTRDERGVHHFTFKSPLNLGGVGGCFGLVQVHSDRMELRGPKLDALLPEKKLPDNLRNLPSGDQLVTYALH